MFALFISSDGSNLSGRDLGLCADLALHQAAESCEEMELMRENVVLDSAVGSELQKMFVLHTVNQHRESWIILIM